MQSKSVDWFLYDNGLRHKRVKSNDSTLLFPVIEKEHIGGDMGKKENQ